MPVHHGNGGWTHFEPQPDGFFICDLFVKIRCLFHQLAQIGRNAIQFHDTCLGFGNRHQGLKHDEQFLGFFYAVSESLCRMRF